ncbi:hypothetical protein [Clostridium felsineum]|uniref:hypothetical protein n=1 Tax=Clostridium felsineum TaxID=36839 RepID=UPI00098CBA49|nr:hypothetical protein [Clostridium felsineum]URZ03020.1 hypothetical protein CLAUR_030660 [Clostridium felsineum]
MNRTEVPFDFSFPDNYMEIKGHDVRLAVSKLHDFSDTLGLLASYSLMYAGEEEYSHFKSLDEIKIKCLKRIYLNNAILWYSNCFDILLQSIWFMDRIWQYYNDGGTLLKDYHKLRNRNGKDFVDIKRNIDGWVQLAEHNCEYGKIQKYLRAYHKKSEVLKELKKFYNKYIKFSSGTKPNIRMLANQIKHNSSLKLKEFETKTTFNLKTDNPMANKILKKNENIIVKFNQVFYNKDAPEEKGKITLSYDKDILVDIKYDNAEGEEFRGQDLLQIVFSIEEIENELNNYHNDIIELYYIIKESFMDNITILPSIKLQENKSDSITIHQPELIPYLEDEEESKK